MSRAPSASAAARSLDVVRARSACVGAVLAGALAVIALVGCGASSRSSAGSAEACGPCEAWNEADHVCVPCLGRPEPGHECACR